MAIEWTQHRGVWSAFAPGKEMLFGRIYKDNHEDPPEDMPWHWAVSTDERRIASGATSSLEYAKALVEQAMKNRIEASVKHPR